MSSVAADLARRLARDAEAVCRRYLSNGRRQGCYWIVGDVHNAKGRSLYVRLRGPDAGPGAAGKWAEYVAPGVMLRPHDLALRCKGSTCSTQHNGALRGDFVMPRDASELARRLARDAQAVCRHYLSNGRRQGRYWTVGDVRNAPGRSMFVRLSGPESGPGAAGHWTDAASAEYGDLLDVIRESCGFIDFRDVAEEARRFLSLSQPPRAPSAAATWRNPAPQGSVQSARRLFAASRPLAGTLAERYLRGRRLTGAASLASLRFHPRCFYRPEGSARTLSFPALIAAVTDLSGAVTGVHRTWLGPAGKAPVETPRRAMGNLLGQAVRFGVAEDVLAAGEGIETVLSVGEALPTLPLAAALSANHLAAIQFPAVLRVLYIVRDADAAGDSAVSALTARAERAGIEPRVLSPQLGDFNDDLCRAGLPALRSNLMLQLRSADVQRFAGSALR